MCWEDIGNLKAMREDKKNRSIRSSLLLTILSSILIALSFVLLIPRTTSAMQFAGIFFFVSGLSFATILFLGIVLTIIGEAFEGDIKSFEGLIAIAHSSVFPSLGLVLAAIMMPLPSLMARIVIAPLIILLTFSSGISLLYRSVKELFKVDILKAFVIISVFMASIFATIWISALYLHAPMQLYLGYFIR